jgi:CheY-like chemotaxis protein
VTFDSSPDHGPHDAGEPAARPATDASRGLPRVLVIDDDPLMGRALLRMLRNSALAVIDNAEGALARVTAGETFDLLLCDVMMPGMTGIDLYQHMARVAPDHARRVVFMTGGASTEETRGFLDTTSNRVLHKPFDMQALREIVQAR